MSATTLPPNPPPALSADRILLLAVALAGALLVSLAGQLVGPALPDIAGGLGATADEASWIATVYAMFSFTGLVAAIPLIRTFGLGRYMAASALVFAACAAGCAAAPPLPLLAAMRALQGAAAGGFGPVAFVAIFTVMGGPRLMDGLALLAFILLLPATLAPVAAGVLDPALGWPGPFLAQAAAGALLTAAAVAFMPRGPINWAALRMDLTGTGLLAIGLAAVILVLSQGTRRFWFESDVILWSTVIGVAAWAGFLVTLWTSPSPVVDRGLLTRPTFVLPISLNFAFRIGSALTVYLIPQFLVVVQGYRPPELASLFVWGAIAQVLAFPLVWWLRRWLDGRILVGSGLLACAAGAALVIDATSQTAAEQFRLALVLAGAGQVMFLVPNLQTGAGKLTPADGPTASLAFNATTLGGVTLGVGLAAELVTEREKLHSNTLVEHVTGYGAIAAERLSALTAALSARQADDTLAAGGAAAAIGGAVRREAWVLAFNDAFLAVALFVAISAAGVLLLPRIPPLSGRRAPQAMPQLRGAAS